MSATIFFLSNAGSAPVIHIRHKENTVPIRIREKHKSPSHQFFSQISNTLQPLPPQPQQPQWKSQPVVVNQQQQQFYTPGQQQQQPRHLPNPPRNFDFSFRPSFREPHQTHYAPAPNAAGVTSNLIDPNNALKVNFPHYKKVIFFALSIFYLSFFFQTTQAPSLAQRHPTSGHRLDPSLEITSNSIVVGGGVEESTTVANAHAYNSNLANSGKPVWF